MNNTSTSNPGVQTRIDGPLGLLILNRPETLNALSLPMICALADGLRTLEADNAVAMIIIRSDDPRAFCAGGDMKQIRERVLEQDHDAIERYFRHEYALNLAIARCRKPLLAIIDGIAMGGGLGISVHGRYRVVTDKAVLAMPESRIGFFPDVGASWFLPRLPRRSGYWLGLSSLSVKGVEARQVGLATHYLSRVDTLEASLATAFQTQPHGDTDAAARLVARVLDEAASAEDATQTAAFEQQLSRREQWFIDDDLDGIRERLTSDADHDEDAARLLELILSASPWSLHHTITLFRQSAGLALEDCLQLELQYAQAACRYPDLAEGVRAVLVDKDRTPAWADLPTGVDLPTGA